MRVKRVGKYAFRVAHLNNHGLRLVKVVILDIQNNHTRNFVDRKMRNDNKIQKSKDFDNSLMELHRHGGAYQRAASQVYALLGKVTTDADNPFEGLKLTKYGETRIKKCWKYDLSKFCRLITIRDNGCTFLCFVGKHSECDKWLEKNRGLNIKVRCDTQPVPTFESIDINDATDRLHGMSNTLIGQSMDSIKASLIEKLMIGIPSSLVCDLKEVTSLTDDNKILELVSQVESDIQGTAILDTLMLLRDGQLQKAEDRIDVFIENLQSITESSNIIDSEFFQTISIDSKHYQELIKHYSKTKNYKDWMLFMHPDQEQFVNAKYSGPSKMSGVSGSGKTCVVVKRAIHLAELYPKEKVLVLTLNRSLATLISDLVNTAATRKSLRKRIKVLPFFSICQDLLKEFEPKNWKLYDDVTWKIEEHIDEVWIEYYRCELNNHDAKVMQKVHDSLIARGIDAESYIREEFDWIRSATSPNSRSDYLKMQRTGRSYQLDESFRRLLLDGLMSWEKKMRDIGVIDYLGLSTALYHYIEKIKPEYRSILIDESQDFGTIELEIIRALVSHEENDLFFCGDAAQQVSSKHQNFKKANISISMSKKLLRNYRNSREILTAAYNVLVNNFSDGVIDNKEFEVLDPSFGYFNGPVPLLLMGESLSQEIAAARYYIDQELMHDSSQKACLVFCGYTLHELQIFGGRLGLPVLDGKRGIEGENLFISDLENSKGFEFQYICILNCSATVIPYPERPEGEQFRDLARLYVAMTRARTQLILSYTGKPSDFLRAEKEDFLEDTWLDYLSITSSELKLKCVPRKLEETRRVDNEIQFAKMTGEQFLYTDKAIGLNSDLIGKIRVLISGKQHTENRRRVKWRNFSDASVDIKGSGVASAVARKQFGKDLESFNLLISKYLI